MTEFSLAILSPDREWFSGAAESVTAPGIAGEFGVLARHEFMVAGLKAGVVTVRMAGVKGLSELRLHRKKGEGTYVVAAEAMEDGRIAISVFDDYRAYLDRWVKESASPADETPAEPPTQPEAAS